MQHTPPTQVARIGYWSGPLDGRQHDISLRERPVMKDPGDKDFCWVGAFSRGVWLLCLKWGRGTYVADAPVEEDHRDQERQRACRKKTDCSGRPEPFHGIALYAEAG